MPTVRYTADGGSYRNREGVRADPDDPEVDVDADMAEYLVENWDFERVAETCSAVKADGEECGRELPCPYHSEGE